MKIRSEMPKLFNILQHPVIKWVKVPLYALSDNRVTMVKSFLLQDDTSKVMWIALV